MEYIALNPSQREILRSEVAAPHSATNTIAIRLELPDVKPESVQSAVDKVFEAADLFSAALVQKESDWFLQPGGVERPHCETTLPRRGQEAWQMAEQLDAQPMGFPEHLCDAQVTPLEEGGSFLHVRFHHILVDGYGMSLFVQAVLDVLAGQTIQLTSFFEHPAEERTRPEDDAYWQRRFTDADWLPALFHEKTEHTTKSSHWVDDSFVSAQDVIRYAEQHQTTPAYVFAAALALYLFQATGKPDVMLLMPRLNRTPEQRKILGCYMQMVPVLVHMSEQDRFSDVCTHLQTAAREASAHKGTGFHRILKFLREESETQDSFSEYGFNFYRLAVKTNLRHKLAFSVAGQQSNHLTFNVFQNANGFSVAFDVLDAVYAPERLGFFEESLRLILQEGLAKDAVNPKAVPAPAETAKLDCIRGKQIQLDDTDTIPSLLVKVASRLPDSPALYAGETSYTFRELLHCAACIAGALLQNGAVAGDRIAYALKRDGRLIPTMLGISMAGCVFVPVDPAYPQERIEYILSDCGAKFLISSPEVEIASRHSYLNVDDLMQGTPVDRLPPVQQTSPAYMIYTSGTTGRPKGVILSHRGIVNIVHPDNNPFNRDMMKEGHGIVAIGSVSFDISLFEIFVPLLNGRFVEFGNEAAMYDAGILADCIQRHHADMLHCTPSRLLAYLSNPKFGEAMHHVKLVLAAGEVLQPSLIARMRDSFGVGLYNGYGPTETTIGATITEANDAETIGKPIANTSILLLNPRGGRVPYGAVGEICVQGAGVGLGYRNREEETRQRFTTWNGQPLYHTGDVGYFTKDGRLHYGGRNDRQIKLRGLRIELPEIERVMEEYTGVREAHCLVRKIGQTEHLVGFYTEDLGTSVDAELLRDHLKSRLTPYMVPDVLKALPQMPQTPGGKTDLRALQREPVDFKQDYRAPENDTERAICQAYGKVLELDSVGADDNFFELGGDSLSAAQLLVAVEQALNLKKNVLEYSQLYQYPTPALLAQCVAGKAARKESYPLETLDYTGIDQYLEEHASPDAAVHRMGNILLTGVTGYLGTHILLELLRHPERCGHIYCLARSKGKLTAVRRVKSTLFYYGEEDFSDCYGTKWTVLEGDITNPKLFAEAFDQPIDVIINAAANVAHFAYGDTLNKTNAEGVDHLIQFAVEQHATLCQVSTISVGGFVTDACQGRTLSESNLYIGQTIGNAYIYSKYLAEQHLLRAAVDLGCKVKILRVGNLQGRRSDGEFQMNMRTNAFTRQLSSYIRICAVPRSVYRAMVNFSPIDDTAERIVTLCATDDSACVFHVYPPQEVAYADLFAALENLNHPVKVLEDDTFEALFEELKQTEEGRKQIEGLLTERPNGASAEVPVVQKITNKILDRVGESWPVQTQEYLNNYLYALDSLSLFEE